jgi:hypothetical protein
MNDDLYNSSSSPAPVTTQEASSVVSDGTLTLPFDWDMTTIIIWLCTFSLVWTVVYSILLILDFRYYRIQYHDYETEREQKGVHSIFSAVSMWWSFLIPTLFAFGYLVTNDTIQFAFGITTIIGYIFKLFIADINDIPYLGNLIGAPGKQWDGLVKSFGEQSMKLVADFIAHLGQLFGGGN